MKTGIHLEYRELRSISPQAARQAILQILSSNKGNISSTARILHTTRKTIYKALRKKKEGQLDDVSTAPNKVANKTALNIEEKVVKLKEKTNYGPLRLKDEMIATYGISVSHHTIRNIVRRNRKNIKKKEVKRTRKSSRPFVDWYSSSAFEIVQIDLKYIIDQKALSASQITHIIKYNLPLYQWGAVDVNSRFKMIAYSKEKSWTNGLTWFLWVTCWLRSHGVTARIVYTVDHGVEFGGDCWYKIVELRKLLGGFGCFVIQNRKKHPEENAHLERSHKTDDDEFYIPRIHTITTQDQFYREAMNYLYYYNCVRKHSSLGRIPPYSYLIKTGIVVDDTIKYVPPIFLDKVSAKLGAWSGYHVLAQYLKIYFLITL
ncbi:transposase [Candidatus Roizmanbacteria bacterium]|nr:transposase [Candidatus Roizmanbacteria bacterium]